MKKLIGILAFSIGIILTTAASAANPATVQYVNTQIQNVNLQIQNLSTQIQAQIASVPPTSYLAGSGISISGKIISVTSLPTTYTAGSGINISGTVISATNTPITYTAGTGIDISGTVISATNTPIIYTAGTGIDISGTVISTTYTAGAGISISGTVISATNTPITYTAGSGINISGTVISATNTPIVYTGGTGINVTGSVISAISPTTYTLGQYAKGGVIFWLDPSKTHGLVAAIADQDGGSGVQWYNGSFTLVGAFADGVWTGQPNTAGIVASQGAGVYAASVCTAYSVTVDGVTYNDWYLPNKTELDLIWLNRAIVNATSIANGGTSLAATSYWSSAESSASNANDQDLSAGTQATTNKSTLFRVRAIRAF